MPRKPYCEKCHIAKGIMHTTIAIRRQNGGVVMKCPNCGHQYTSYSQTAYRLMADLEKPTTK